MAVLRVGFSGGNCDPYGTGIVKHAVEDLGGLRLRHAVSAVPAEGYEFINWDLDIPDLPDGDYFDSGSLSAIKSQVNSSTIVWDDPEIFDGGFGVGFIAHMRKQEMASGAILYGKTELPVFGNKGTLLFKS